MVVDEVKPSPSFVDRRELLLELFELLLAEDLRCVEKVDVVASS